MRKLLFNLFKKTFGLTTYVVSKKNGSYTTVYSDGPMLDGYVKVKEVN